MINQSFKLKMAGVVQVINPDGSVASEAECHGDMHLDGNGYTTLGLNDVLNKYYAGSAYTAAFYLGLVDNSGFSTFAPGDTMASHIGWSENTNYSASNRFTIAFGVASGASQVSGNCDFSINATVTIKGCFITDNNTKGGSTGLLSSTLAFASPQSLVSGQTLRIIITNTASG